MDNNSFEINSLINEKDDLTHRINEIENVKNALKSENGQLKQENEGGNQYKYTYQQVEGGNWEVSYL